MLRLNRPQVLELRDLLRAAFTEDEFEELLFGLDRDIADYAAAGDPYPTKLRDVLQRANARLWWRELLRQACDAQPADVHLQTFAATVGFASHTVDATPAAVVPVNGRKLELKIRDAQSTVDIVIWRQKLAAIEGRVCRIELPEKTPQGTGFLVAPDLVMTNYHVIESVQKGMVDPKHLRVRFDYKVLANGVSVGEGRTCKVAAHWLADFSPYSVQDFESAPAIDPASDELDYALLRLDARAGDDALDEGVTRGWIQAPAAAHDFATSPALYIVQHPNGHPMQVAIDSHSVIKSSATRVRYTTTTEKGSSGSPCFSADWDWVALHHSGDPKYWKEGKKPEYNQGIPVTAIVKLLKQRGLSALLGGS